MPAKASYQTPHIRTLRAVRQGDMSFEVAFHLARHRAQVPGDAQKAFAEDLLAAFATPV